tara:strand:+ start:198 stop:638 length:441 start_codon:yes stop_codon:yes gene_type:complete
MFFKYLLALLIMLCISVPVMLLSSVIISYLIGTIITAWSVEGGNLQIIGYLYELFGISTEITTLIGQFFVSEIVLFGAIAGQTYATFGICQKYLSEVKIMNLSMIFATMIILAVLFYDTTLSGIFNVLFVLNIYIFFYVSAWACKN